MLFFYSFVGLNPLMRLKDGHRSNVSPVLANDLSSSVTNYWRAPAQTYYKTRPFLLDVNFCKAFICKRRGRYQVHSSGVVQCYLCLNAKVKTRSERSTPEE